MLMQPGVSAIEACVACLEDKTRCRGGILPTGHCGLMTPSAPYLDSGAPQPNLLLHILQHLGALHKLLWRGVEEEGRQRKFSLPHHNSDLDPRKSWMCTPGVAPPLTHISA